MTKKAAGLQPFFSYFGSKWRITPKYPRPTRGTIVEPFAGSAGYSLRYFNRQVHLNDLDPVIHGVWNYLINVSEAEFMKLPAFVPDVRDLQVPEEARWLIGFNVNHGCTHPSNLLTRWAKDKPSSYWGKEVRYRIACQLRDIRHWKVTNKDYRELDLGEATWFVDPPYFDSGKFYKHKDIDYPHLGAWCRERQGQVIVCEQKGADWLPFTPYLTIDSMKDSRSDKAKAVEVMWRKDDPVAVERTGT